MRDTKPTYNVINHLDPLGAIEIIHAGIPSLEGAKALRTSPWDIVVFSDTLAVVPLTDWLWPYEVENPESYAALQANRSV